MVWKHQHKLIFIHIPKTGGSSIENALGIRCVNTNLEDGYGIVNRKARQHYFWNDYARELGIEVFDDYEKFTIVRNPYDRIVSEYFWCQVRGVGSKHGQTFDQFLQSCKEIVSKENFNASVYHDHFAPQHVFIYDSNSVLKVDKVFKFENYPEVENYLKEKIGIARVPHLNTNGHKRPLELTDEQKALIYEIYNKDFELLGYSR